MPGEVPVARRALPLSRFVLWIDAVICTADWVRHNREGKAEAKTASEFLAKVCPEDYLTLAMMCDASDEVLMLLRFYDDENASISEAPDEVDRFKRNVHFLFIQSGCLRITGFTFPLISRFELSEG